VSKKIVLSSRYFIFDYPNCKKIKKILIIHFFFVSLQQKIQLIMTNNQQGESYNRIKVVLVEQGKTSRWLAEQIDKCENTVSRWCLNKVQPSLPQLAEIAKVLDVDVRSLIAPTKY
jgi:DNA-binding XRE family transcriptional regulator